MKYRLQITRAIVDGSCDWRVIILAYPSSKNIPIEVPGNGWAFIKADLYANLLIF